MNEFTLNKQNKNGYEHRCRKCANISKNKWEKTNRDGYKRAYLKYRFDITLEQYNIMLTNQDNRCDICKLPEIEVWKASGKLKDLCVDHCHKTGQVRALLCRKCNTGLGSFRDTVPFLESAIKYLQKHSK